MEKVCLVQELRQVDEVRKWTLIRACQAASHIAENTSFSFRERLHECLSGIDDLKSWGLPPSQVSPRALLDGFNLPITIIMTLNEEEVNASEEDAAEEVIRACEGELVFDEGLTRADKNVTPADKNVTSSDGEVKDTIEIMKPVEAMTWRNCKNPIRKYPPEKLHKVFELDFDGFCKATFGIPPLINTNATL